MSGLNLLIFWSILYTSLLKVYNPVSFFDSLLFVWPLKILTTSNIEYPVSYTSPWTRVGSSESLESSVLGILGVFQKVTHDWTCTDSPLRSSDSPTFICRHSDSLPVVSVSRPLLHTRVGSSPFWRIMCPVVQLRRLPNPESSKFNWYLIDHTKWV